MTSTATAPTSVSRVDPDRAIATLVTAFSADPVVRWFYPDASSFLTHFPETLRIFGELAFDAGTVDCADDYAGTALWLGPGISPDAHAVLQHVQRSVQPARHESVLAFLGEMDEHHPTEACWYLPFIGTDPRSQGQGHGSRLLEQGLARCDHDRLPAYLEATSHRNRTLYERHGFAVVGEIQVGDSPLMLPMLRKPR